MMNHWILLQKQEPKNQQRCIVCYRHRFYKPGEPGVQFTEWHVSDAYYSMGRKTWTDGYFGGHELSIDVVYWMPFPKPPSHCINESKVMS